MAKSFFAIWKKVCIFAVDFNSEINEALYLRLAVRNVRNFYDMQGWYDGFARISVGCFHFYISGQFSRPLTGEVVRGTTLFNYMLNEVRKSGTKNIKQDEK